MKFDILSIHERATTMKIEGGRATSLKTSDIQRYGVRRFENGKVYQTSRLGQANENRLLADTKEFGGPGVIHDYGFAPEHSENREGIKLNPETIAEFEESVQKLAVRHPKFSFTGSCVVKSITTKLTSNYGLNLETSGDSCDWFVAYSRLNSGNVFDGVVGDEWTSRPMIREVLEGQDEYLRVQANEVALKPGRIPILMTSPFTPMAKLQESLLINTYREGASLYAGRLGENLFSPEITLIDRAYAPEVGHNQFFDGEGTVRAQDPLVVVDKGRFNSLISNLRFAKKFETSSTGNGIRDYNTGVVLGVRNLSFAKGSRSWREILKSLDRCILAIVAAGGDTNDLGEFSSPVQMAYVFEKGEVVGRAPQVTVKAQLTEYLGRGLLGVASDGWLPTASSPVLISEMDMLVN